MSFASSSSRFVGRNFPFIFPCLLCSNSCPLGLRRFAFALYIYYLKWSEWRLWPQSAYLFGPKNMLLNSKEFWSAPFCGVPSTFEGIALACIWWLLKLWIAPFVWLCVVNKAFTVRCRINNIPLTTYSISYYYLYIKILMSIEESKIAIDKSPLPKSMWNDSGTRDSATGLWVMAQSKRTFCDCIHLVWRWSP